jgi:hypothetical protein
MLSVYVQVSQSLRVDQSDVSVSLGLHGFGEAISWLRAFYPRRMGIHRCLAKSQLKLRDGAAG